MNEGIDQSIDGIRLTQNMTLNVKKANFTQENPESAPFPAP